jgi:hypothetical protein
MPSACRPVPSRSIFSTTAACRLRFLFFPLPACRLPPVPRYYLRVYHTSLPYLGTLPYLTYRHTYLPCRCLYILTPHLILILLVGCLINDPVPSHHRHHPRKTDPVAPVMSDDNPMEIRVTSA